MKDFKNKVCLINLDLDIYSSYEFAINQIVKNVVKGGVIIIDEYNSKNGQILNLW